MENNNENKTIFDININSIQDLYGILLNKGYDFLTIEADEEKASVKFRKDGKIVEERFIKLRIYSEIIIKAKTISGLDIGVTNEEQEGTGEISINEKKYNSLAKVVPTKFGEKLFLKLKVIEQKIKTNNGPQKIELGKVIGFFGAVLIIILIVGGGFLSFVVLNAKTIEDVNFFLSLGINPNEINSFIGTMIGVFFSTLTLILTIFLIIFLFRFLLTKKIFKKKKTTAGILALLFFILTFSSAFSWLYLHKAVKNLPKWDIIALGDVQLFDNKIYNSSIIEKIYLGGKEGKVSEGDKKSYSNISADSARDLIGPVEILLDVEQLQRKEESGNLKVDSFIWEIGEDKIETKVPRIIKKFDKKGNYDIKIKFLFKDGTIREFDNKKAKVPSIGITGVVDIREKELNSGAKLITFDASNLKELGKFEWHNLENNTGVPISEKSVFITNPIFDEAAFKLVLKNGTSSDNKSNEKVFIIDGEQESNISGEIEFIKSITDDKEYTFKIKNPKANEGIGFIENYLWRIDNREFEKKGDIENQEKASEVKYQFQNYGKYEISVVLTPSSGETKRLTKTIDVSKDLKIRKGIDFSTNSEKVENIRHNKNTGEYFIEEFGIPSILDFDARYVKADSENYSLNEVSWDYNSDGKIDEVGKKGKLNILKEGREKVTVNYKFKNIRIDDDIVDVKEIIYIEAIKKEYDINFKIDQHSEYAPTLVGFDATKSTIKDGNITKFIWDFGDGIKEEGDAVIEGHRYLKDGEYDVKLTIIGSDGRKFTSTKKLVLKPKAQKVKFKASLKEAPVYQGIDFDSSESIGDIVSYVWDFGDGNTSTEANPTHMYEKPGKYKVKLTVDFRNRNIMEEFMDIIITK